MEGVTVLIFYFIRSGAYTIHTVWKTLNHSNTPSISYWMEACHCFIFLFIRSGAYKIYCVKNNNKWNKLFGPNFNFVGSGEHKCHLNYGLRRWGVTGHCVGLASCNVPQHPNNRGKENRISWINNKMDCDIVPQHPNLHIIIDSPFSIVCPSDRTLCWIAP